MLKIISQILIFTLCHFTYSQNPSFKGLHSNIPFNEATIEDIDSKNFPDMIKSFDYPNAQISDIVMAMSHLTGVNFIIDPNVKGTISIVAPTPITVAEAFQAFLSALAINGFALVRSGAFWKVTSAENASRDNLQIYKGEYFPDADQYITKVFKLKHANVKNLEKHLKQFLTKDKHKAMFYEQANTIIISDYGSAIEKINQIIKELDVSDVHNIVEVINIKYAEASDLALKLQTLLSQGKTSSFTPSSRRIGANLISSKQVNTTGISAIIPDERTNSIIISGSKKGIKKAKSLIAKLDFYIDPQTAGGIYVYYVKHGKAKDLETTLNSILGPQVTQSKGGSPRGDLRSFRNIVNLQKLNRTGIQDNIRIAHDKNTNSLLVTSSKHDFDILQKNILAKIDIPKNQVFIKTIIMDLNAEDDLDWDLNYYNFVSHGRAGLLPHFAFNSRNIFNVLQDGITGKSTGSILNLGLKTFGETKLNISHLAQLATGKSLSLKKGSEIIELPSILALVNIIKQKTNGNILSTPQIIAIDNEPSSISVGFDVPVGESTQLANTGIVSTSHDRKDVSTILKITPYINPDGQSVRLQIEQTIDSIDPTTRGPKELENKSITITKRAIKTNIILNDQETAVLGGLMNDEETERVQKIPILGDIPFLGWLFQAKNTDKRKKNLLVFITPKIIKNTFDHQSILQDKIDEKINFIKKYMGNKKRSQTHIQKFLSHMPPQKKSETAQSSNSKPEMKIPEKENPPSFEEEKMEEDIFYE